jgi:hypothetical protein
MKQTMLNLQPPPPAEAILIIDGRIIKKVIDSLGMSEKINVMEYIPKWNLLAKYANEELTKTYNKTILWKRYYFEFGETQELEIFYKNLSEKFHEDFKAVLIETTAQNKWGEKIKEFLELLEQKHTHVILVTDDLALIPALANIQRKKDAPKSVIFCGYIDTYSAECLKNNNIEYWDIVSKCKAAKEIPIFKTVNLEDFDPSELL